VADPLRNACVTAVRDELDRYELKSEAEVVNNGHVEVSWEWNGQRRRSRMSATPSDCYAHLKALAAVKRILRQDGVQPPPPKSRNVVTLSHALSAPKPVPLPVERIAKLESDFDGLLEMLVESQGHLELANAEIASLKHQFANMRITVSFDAAVPASISANVPAPVVTREKRTYAPRSGESQVARVLKVLHPGGWMHTQTIQKEAQVPLASMGAILNLLKKSGKVENGQRGWWRLVPDAGVKVTSG